MKDDVPVPDTIPKKRRELQSPATLDRFIATWLARGDLTPSERRRLEEEKARRKQLEPDVRVAIIVGNEGMTPPQTVRVAEIVADLQPTALHVVAGTIRHTRTVRRMLDAVGVDRLPIGFADEREMLRSATCAVAAPKEPEKPDSVQGVWDAVRFAKHRKIPVRVVMPSGDERS